MVVSCELPLQRPSPNSQPLLRAWGVPLALLPAFAYLRSKRSLRARMASESTRVMALARMMGKAWMKIP